VATFGHNSTHSLKGLISRDDATLTWGSPDLTGFRDTYISYWEYDDANGLMNTEIALGGVNWDNGAGLTQFMSMDNQQLGQCGNSQLGNNARGNILLVFGGTVGPTTSGQNYSDQTGCLAMNSPSWGNWTQWEMRIRINDPTPLGQTSNAQFQLYENGVLVSQMPSGRGQCSSQTFPCSNLSGSTDLGAVAHLAFVGGISTTIVAWADAAHTICSVNGGAVNSFTRPSNFNSLSPCPLQEPPNGYFNSSAAGGFNRYFDDIIVLKR
jgi:hypothetical protein